MKQKTPKQSSLDPQLKFMAARKELSTAMIERDEEIDMVLTALICKENPLLVGPPGTGKSFLLDAVMNWMGPQTKKFNILMGKFTTPEEVFGPISVQGLKNDCYRRITTDMLPEAIGAFIDEIFKSSTAILNTLLRILNERTYNNQPVPLKICVAASNEWPSSQEELDALFDRFLFRKTVRPISSKQGLDRLLWGGIDTTISNTISPEEIETAQKEASKLEFTKEAMDSFREIIDQLRKEGIRPGDRRMRKSVAAVRAYAYLNGACDEDICVETEHLGILAHTMWDSPEEQPEKAGKIVARIANPTRHLINENLMNVQDILDKNSPTEIVPKLQAIQKSLQALPKNGINENSLKAAMSYVSGQIEDNYRKVIGA